MVLAPGGGRSKGMLIGAVGGAIGLVVVVAALTLGGGDDSSTDGTKASTTPGSTLPGTATTASSGRGLDAIVSAVPMGQAPISDIRALTVDQQGALYIVGVDAVVLRVSDGESAPIANSNPALGVPGGVAVAPDGTVLLTTSAGIVAIAGGGSPTVVLDAATAGLGATPGPITLDGLGNMYFADNDTHRIIRRGTDGVLSLIAGSGVAATPGPLVGDGQPAGTVPIGVITGLAIDPGGNLVFADATTLAVRQVAGDGTLSTLASGGAFLSLDGLAVDAAGRVYVADSVSGAIVRIADGTIEIVIVRQDGIEPVDGVAASESSVTAVGAITIDRVGTLFFEDGATVRSLSVA